MKKITLLCLTALPLLFCACQSEKDKLTHIWFFISNDTPGGVKDTLFTPASFIDLRADGRYTLDFHRFDYGQWRISDHNTIVLTNDKGHTSTIGFDYISAKDLRLHVDDLYLSFEGLSNRSLSEAADPFSLPNNRWRIPSPTKDNDRQITARLVNHFHFWKTYFSWGIDQQLQYLDVRSTPTPIKIYGNGFGLKPVASLPLAWKNYFHDEEDIQKANDKIQVLFDNNSIAWPHTDNKYKMFLSAFQQMEQKIQ
ncbi:MAG: hypothetical protein JST39_02555 [Bacteroidetes bacterium]|nr:hypothetical protein [Bacteroidota bacterium]